MPVIMRLDSIVARVLIGVLVIYRKTISPVLPRACRFVPTCSEYAVEALARHGSARGTLMAIRRVARCHPLGGSGLDPVP